MMAAPEASPVRVLAPDAMHLPPSAFASLGTARVPSGTRAALIERCRHMVATAFGKPVGIAAFEVEQDIVRVHEIAAAENARGTLEALVTAVELACLASGASRIFISTLASATPDVLAEHGYRNASGTRWLEKCVP